MPDFSQVNQYRVPMDTFAANLTMTDLRQLTNQSIDRLVELIEQCSEGDIIRVPNDPDAFDAYAAKFRPEEATIGWTIGHNIVHTTASGEEYAFNAAELARGVPYHGRSRYETPWQTVTTVAQCLARLEESRRLRLASLDLWPNEPDLKNGVTPWRESGWVNAIGLFAWGLAHDDSHWHQIRKIMAQLQEVSVLFPG
ncbi:MAG: DinB family protein [Anaerolineae bacterium]|nr:DinB family protein [Anaerolineae bacterium]